MRTQYCIYRGDGRGATFADINATQQNGREAKRGFHGSDATALAWFEAYHERHWAVPSRVILFRANRGAVETVVSERAGK